MRTEPLEISGAGGGKGGGGGTFTQTPDNLRSEDVFEGLLGLGQGPWVGPRKGLESVRIEGTPLEDANGSVNFPGWVTVFANGDPTAFPQKPALKLGNASTPLVINVALSNTVGPGSGTPVVRTVTNPGPDAIDLRFIVSQLYYQNKKGVFNNTMNIKIRMRPNGHTTWIDVLLDTTATEPDYQQGGKSIANTLKAFVSKSYYDSGGNRVSGSVSGQLTIQGKTTQAYVKEVRIALPTTGDYVNKTWDIECTLVEKESVDNDPIFEKREVSWESAAAVFKTDLGAGIEWLGLSWMSLYGAASDRISGVPNIWTEFDTKIVSVPPTGVFDPASRFYTGTVWDGSWVKSYTRDPAWILCDMVSDPLAGVSSIAPGSFLNKWDALELSKHCSELVPDGDIGMAYFISGITTVPKANVRTAVGSNVNTASPGATLAGVTMVASDRVLLYGQTAPAENGIYLWNGAASAMTRAADADTAGELLGAAVYCTAGTNAERWYKQCQTIATLGTTAVRFVPCHPRYVMDYTLDQSMKADDVIKNVAGAVGAIAWDDGNGEWRCKTERAETPLAVFTEENIEGEFTYTHTDVDTRYNDITVVFKNAEFEYREDRVRVFDQPNIDLQGRKAISIVALGCTNRQEAVRRGMLRLRASLNEFRVVNFTTNRQARYLERLATILVADKSLGYVPPTASLVAASVLPAVGSWTPTGATISDQNDYFKITDDSAAVSESIAASANVPAGTATAVWRIRKDEIPKATRYVKMRLSQPDAGWVYEINLDTKSGEFTHGATSGSPTVTVNCIDDGAENWLAYVQYTSTGSNVTTSTIFPAAGTVLGTATVATQGYCGVAEAGIYPSSVSALQLGFSRHHTTGRMIGLDGPRTTITLRDPLRIEPGASYTIKVTVPNPNYSPTPSTEPTNADWNKPTIVQSYTVHTSSPRGDVTSILLTSALPANVPANAPIALDATGLPTLPKTYRMTDITLDDDGERCVVTAIEVDTGKQAAADTADTSDIDAQVADYTTPPPVAPAGGVLNLLEFPSAYGTQKVLEVDWEKPNSKFIAGYEVWYRYNDGPRTYLNTTTGTRTEIPNPQFGFYTVEVISIDRRGQRSVPLLAVLEIVEAPATAAIGYLTNEHFTVPTDATGVVTSYTGAGGTFKVLLGTVDITLQCTFAITANPQTLTASINSSGVYSVTAGLDAAEPTGSLTFTATHPDTGFTVVKTFTLAKSNGPRIELSAPSTSFKFVDNVLNPGGQSITFTATKYNTTETINWSSTPSVTLTGTGDSRSLSAANFGANREVVITATGATSGVTDTFTVFRLDVSTAEAGANTIGDGNRIRYSLMEGGVLGWETAFTGATGAISKGVTGGIPWIKNSITFTANSQVGYLRSGTTVGTLVPVTAGERLSVSAAIETVRPDSLATWELEIKFRNSAGTELTASSIASGSADQTFATRQAAFVTVPATAVTGYLRLWMNSNTGGAGSGTIAISQPMICSAGIAQTVHSPFTPGPSNEYGADVTSVVDGPATSVFLYDYTGATAEAGQFTRDLTYKLMTGTGYVSSGVTWTYLVKTGTVNTFTNASGAQSMTGSGSGTFSISSLGSSTAEVEITAAYGGINRTMLVTLSKQLAVPPIGGGGGTTIASKTSGFVSINSTTFTDITGTQTGTVPSGKTAASLSMALNATPAGATNGTWTVEMKFQRNISSVWTDKGTTQSAGSSWQHVFDPEEFLIDPAPFNYTFSDTGLTGGTAYDWRIVARLTSGTRSHAITGSFTVVVT